MPDRGRLDRGQQQREEFPNLLRQRCPKCEAPSGEPCRDLRWQPAWYGQPELAEPTRRPHREREMALRQAIFDIDNYADDDD